MGDWYLSIMQLGIYLYFELICLFTAIFFYIKKRNKLLLYFIPFLLLTVAVEFTGWWWTLHIGYWKYAMYNIFTAFEFIFYAFIFYIHFKKLSFKSTVLFFFPLFILCTLINMFFIQGLNQTFNTYTFLLGSFCIVVFCCFFFYESVLPDKIDQQLSRQPFFWISSGLLINYLGSVIINALFEYLTTNDLRIEGQQIYGIINKTLIVILYSSFCIAFYLCRDNRKTYSLQS